MFMRLVCLAGLFLAVGIAPAVALRYTPQELDGISDLYASPGLDVGQTFDLTFCTLYLDQPAGVASENLGAKTELPIGPERRGNIFPRAPVI